MWSASRAPTHFAEHYGTDPETPYRQALAVEESALQTFEQVGAAPADTVARLSEETEIPVVVISVGLATAWEFFEPSLRSCLDVLVVVAVKTKLRNPSLAVAAALFQG